MSDMPSAAGKKESGRQCASCRGHKCNKVTTCAGRGGHSLCKCTDHPIIKNPVPELHNLKSVSNSVLCLFLFLCEFDCILAAIGLQHGL